MDKVMNLHYSFDSECISDVKDVNSSFARGRLKICYTGMNRNGSFISRDSIERALPSLYNVPIVCHWDYEDNQIGGHDVEVVERDGELRLHNLTEPCGVVPESAEFSFENETDDNGKVHEYLVANNVLLWKRQDVYSHIVNDLGGKCDHSMEITISDGDMDKANKCYMIKDFQFTALCLLERDEPCFQGSELELFACKNFKEKMDQMLSELKDTIMSVSNPEGDENIKENSTTEGGEEALGNENATPVCASNSEDLTAQNFSGVDNATVDATCENIADEAENSVVGTEQVEEHTVDNPADGDQFALNSQIQESLYEAIRTETVDSPWGEMCRYWMVDFDVDKNEVYVIDTEEEFHLYGFTYAMNGDAVAVDFDSKKRMKYAIVEFDDGEQMNPVNDMFGFISEKSANYKEICANYERDKGELESLRQFKEKVEEDEVNNKRDELFSRFEDIRDTDAFKALEEHVAEYSIEELEEKCYAIRGRNNTPAKFSAEVKSTPKLKVQKADVTKKEPYGGLFEKYGSKNND